MDWLFAALVSGSLVTSLHGTEEACLGRKALFEKEHKVLGICAKMHGDYITYWNGPSNRLGELGGSSSNFVCLDPKGCPTETWSR